jgi:hypothetical protein
LVSRLFTGDYRHAMQFTTKLFAHTLYLI